LHLKFNQIHNRKNKKGRKHNVVASLKKLVMFGAWCLFIMSSDTSLSFKAEYLGMSGIQEAVRKETLWVTSESSRHHWRVLLYRRERS
jgi:hypothetical protein